MRIVPILGWALLTVGVLAFASASADDAGSTELTAQLERGAELYRLNCAVCHGATGLGYAEARAAFPPDHRRCTRCHRPNNRAVMSLEEITDDHDLFSLGDPPALRGDGALAAFPNALALNAYNAAAMPRYEPGRLAAQAYLDITAWLLAENGRLGGDAPLTADDAAERGRP